MEKRTKRYKKGMCLAVCILLLVTGCGRRSFQENLSAEADRTAAYLVKATPAPTMGSIGGEWLIKAVADSGYQVKESYYSAYYDTIRAAVKSAKGVLTDRYYTTYARVTIALCAIGKDPTDVEGYDLVAPLDDYEMVTGQGMNAAAFALIASQVAGVTLTHESDYIAYLMEKNEAESYYLDADFTDYTAMTLQALAYYNQLPEVNDFVALCVESLSQIQSAQGDYGNCESTAECIIALTALGIDPFTDNRFIKNGISLGESLTHFKEGKGYIHERGGKNFDGQMSTEQALLAIDAMQNFGEGHLLYEGK